MNQDYERIVAKAQELLDMLEALANKKLAQGRDEEAATLTAIRMNVASLVVYDVVTPKVEVVDVFSRRRSKKETLSYTTTSNVVVDNGQPPDDPTPEGVPAL